MNSNTINKQIFISGNTSPDVIKEINEQVNLSFKPFVSNASITAGAYVAVVVKSTDVAILRHSPLTLTHSMGTIEIEMSGIDSVAGYVATLDYLIAELIAKFPDELSLSEYVIPTLSQGFTEGKAVVIASPQHDLIHFGGSSMQSAEWTNADPNIPVLWQAQKRDIGGDWVTVDSGTSYCGYAKAQYDLVDVTGFVSFRWLLRSLTGDVGEVFTDVSEVNVIHKAVVITQPKGVTVDHGEPSEVSVEWTATDTSKMGFWAVLIDGVEGNSGSGAMPNEYTHRVSETVEPYNVQFRFRVGSEDNPEQEVLSDIAYVEVNAKPEYPKPEVDVQPIDTQILEGEEGALSVTWSVDPARVVWRKDGSQIGESNQDFDGIDTNALTIKAMNADNVGEYACRGYSADGEQITTSNIAAVTIEVPEEGEPEAVAVAEVEAKAKSKKRAKKS